MAKRNDYIPASDSLFIDWCDNFLNKLTTLAPSIDVSPAELADITNYINDFKASHTLAVTRKAEAKSAVSAANNKRVLTETEARRLVRNIKNNTAYTEAIGNELMLIGPQEIIDLLNVKPEDTTATVLADKVVLDWHKKNLQAVVIYSVVRVIRINSAQALQNSEDDASGQLIDKNEWFEIGRDINSPFEDTRKNLTDGPEIRYYKLRYIYKDQIVGLDSDIIKVIVDIR